MDIFVDESGSFVAAARRNFWNAIVAYMVPGGDRQRLWQALTELQTAAGVRQPREVKLREVDERSYFDFLARVNELHGILFAVATDAGRYNVADIEKHRNTQASEVVRHLNIMRYESGRQALKLLSHRIRGLSPQLYIQLKCQVVLMDFAIKCGTLYFVQRFPKDLGRFRWRIDQKNSTKTEYETAFEMLTPAWLQSFSLEKPFQILEEADYSAFRRFQYSEGSAPTYLKTAYRIDVRGAISTNIGQLVREDLKFVDSQRDHGVQIADFLDSGLRRCLRGQFNDNQQAARLLGSLMPQGEMNGPPLKVLGFSEKNDKVTGEVTSLIHTMAVHSRPMVLS